MIVDVTGALEPRTVDAVVAWKKALAVSLVVLVVLIGVPVLMPGMGSAMCPDCPDALTGGCTSAVLLSAMVLMALLLALLPRPRRDRWRVELFAFALERPPRLV